MKIFVFDTETSGLPIVKGFNNYYDYNDVNKYDNSRLLSICWYIYEDNNLIKKYYNFIKHLDFTIDNNSVACKINKITQELVNKKGIKIVDMFTELKNDLDSCNLIVAHNFNFDKHILLSELYRCNLIDIIQMFLNKEHYCTMLNGKNITKIKFKNSNMLKPPKLSELYYHYFNKDFDNAHDAESDVKACADCFFMMYH